MSKSVYIFTILVIFVAIAVWFVVQKTREVNEVTETPMPTAVATLSPDSTSSPQATPEDSAGKPIKYDNGLVVQDVVVGSGKTAESGDTLNAHYIGALENGTVFDNSYDRGQPLQFVLGSGQLIQGWELGLIGMKEGGKRKLLIPPELGYGSRGAGKAIPPNATLLFEIELIGVIKK